MNRSMACSAWVHTLRLTRGSAESKTLAPGTVVTAFSAPIETLASGARLVVVHAIIGVYVANHVPYSAILVGVSSTSRVGTTGGTSIGWLPSSNRRWGSLHTGYVISNRFVVKKQVSYRVRSSSRSSTASAAACSGSSSGPSSSASTASSAARGSLGTT